jgi:hypothetical protein
VVLDAAMVVWRCAVHWLHALWGGGQGELLGAAEQLRDRNGKVFVLAGRSESFS